jgi:hypothetical protein
MTESAFLINGNIFALKGIEIELFKNKQQFSELSLKRQRIKKNKQTFA